MERSKKMLLFFSVLLTLCAFALPALAAGTDTVVPSETIQDKVAEFLTSGVVSTLLLIIGISGIVIELATVGSFGIFGAMGVLGFALYFMGAMWSGSMTTAALWLLLGGVVLLIIEILVTPGFGVPGTLGIFAIFAALVIASPRPAYAIWELLIALVVAGGLIWYTLKNKKTRRVWNKLILKKKTDAASGFNSADPTLSRYLGKRGRAVTLLRPAGTAEIEGERVDVVTQGEYISPGTEIEVFLVEGVRIVVREVHPQ